MKALRDVTKARHAITEVVSCQLFFFFFFFFSAFGELEKEKRLSDLWWYKLPLLEI